MIEYRLGQRLKCIKELSVWYHPDNWSKLEEYVVRLGDMYMITEMEQYNNSICFFLAPLGKDNIALELWHDNGGYRFLDRHFETCN